MKKGCENMNDLLTTRELQELLCVDRKTIYRMLKDGRLPATRVGGQWRFSREVIQAWLDNPNAVMGSTPATKPTPDILPLDCFLNVQQVFATAMEVGVTTVDVKGEMLIEPSSGCEFCQRVLASFEGRKRCREFWLKQGQAEGAPRFETCPAGLTCATGRIVVDGEFMGMVAACQFVRSKGEREAIVDRVPKLAAELHISRSEFQEAAQVIPVLDSKSSKKTLALVNQVARTFSGIGNRRLELIVRLRQVAELAKV